MPPDGPLPSYRSAERRASANPSCTASRPNSRSPAIARATCSNRGNRSRYSTSTARRVRPRPITSPITRDRILFSPGIADSLGVRGPAGGRSLRGATLRVSGKRRARATAAARENAILRAQPLSRSGGADVSRAMLQTMICGGAEHVTAILKLNRVGLRSRALLTSCPFRYDQPAGRVRTAAALRDPHPFVPRHPLGEVPRERGAIPRNPHPSRPGSGRRVPTEARLGCERRVHR